ISANNHPFSNLKVFFVCLILWGQSRHPGCFLLIYLLILYYYENGEVKHMKTADVIIVLNEIEGECEGRIILECRI
ncbi:hypothetical protein, partial [Bacillus amyloliquefaciens]|uniref:hypothetical protein n=1 Tax=Bacillus amyloliquefaciens TaxID=1390 RepID=UPI001CD5A33D